MQAKFTCPFCHASIPISDEKDFVFGALVRDDAKRFIAAAIMQDVGKV